MVRDSWSVCLSVVLSAPPPPPHLVCSCTVYARVARHVTRHPPKRILFLSRSLPLSLSQASKANKQTGNQAKQANKQASNQAINLIVTYMGRWLLPPPLLLLLPLRAIVAISMHICLRRTRCTGNAEPCQVRPKRRAWQNRPPRIAHRSRVDVCLAAGRWGPGPQLAEASAKHESP